MSRLVTYLRSAILPARRSRPMRAAFGALVRNAHRWGKPGGVADHVTRSVCEYGVFEPGERSESVHELVDLFFDLCAIGSVDLFVEAGAKEASASVRAADVLTADVVAFEANPFTYRRFAASHEERRFDYVHAALVDEPGPRVFLVRLTESGRPAADGQGSLLRRPDHAPGYRHETVDGVTLDGYIGDLDRHRTAAFERIAMWVDVEGAIAEVFGGAGRVLGRTDLVIAEVESRPAWEGQQYLVDDVTARLAEFGLVPVARDVQSRWQFNVMFARASLLDDPDVADRLRRWRSGRPAADSRSANPSPEAG